MSLVSYDYSSAEESDDDGAEQTTQSAKEPLKSSADSITGPETATKRNDTDEPDSRSVIHLQLPAPKKANDLNVEEEDDEFLRKKATPVEAPPAKESNIKPTLRNGKVQITIPSMNDFKDVDGPGGSKKDRVVVGAALPKKATGLLSILPKPKTHLFQPSSKPQPSLSASSETGSGFSKRLVPDSVANRPRSVPASAPKSTVRPPLAPAKHSSQDPDSDDGDDGTTDYFSFNKVDTLPTVSANEITAMVAKKAAKMADTVRKFTETEASAANVSTNQCTTEPSASVMPESAQPTDLANETAMAALIGGNRAKRARLEQVDLIEITSEDIVPSKEDFLRRQLQDETGYVPTGHLVGDWTCTSRRKSHITQLANKAQANAQELEAMWAANRQSRRQTQSKYGF
ncbi:proline-rich protein PRCC [Anopheles bellator]|uniref:proline-rich protein PRCC n=1 Tax=Anopheles bellator TaxID=139047 RepID=UPI002648AAAF|nr:proline-rich protein PRCC [Anopheles bellator]